MSDTTYNGWTNYSTWRINLEFVDDNIYNCETTADGIQAMVEEHLECECGNETTLSYAMAFIDDVNWLQIAKHIAEEVA